MLTEHEKKLIREYKYKGGDTSPIYQYILSPWAQFLVDHFTPLWVAPNVLTFLGLIFSFICCITTLIVNPTLESGGPRWLNLLTAFCIFAYQTLDNMDGKQARRTGSSSALGMAFDHGCDAVNSGVTIIAMASVMGTGWSGKFFITYVSASIPFFFQTWEEYYSGSMILPAFNGPTEGLLMSMGVGIIAFFTGSEPYHQELIRIPEQFLFPANCITGPLGYPTLEDPRVTPFTIFLLIVSAAVIGTVIVHTVRVYITVTEKNQSVVSAMLNLIPFLIFFPGMYYYSLNSEISFKQYPVVACLLYGSGLSEMLINIMVYHMIERPLEPWTRYSVYFIAILSAMVYFQVETKIETMFLFVSTAISVVSMLTYVAMICHEFSVTLDIYIFKLGKRSDHVKLE